MKESRRKRIIKRSILIVLDCLLAAIVVLLLIKPARTAASATPVQEETETETEQETTTEPETTTEAETEPAGPADVTAPVIEGMEDIYIHVNETVAYKQGVTVTDDMDPEPKLTIDNSRVSLDTIGSYSVIYVAEDASGNRTCAVRALHIVPPEEVTTESAYALADEILDSILYEGMSDYERLHEIYWYLHRSGYVDIDYAEAIDYLVNAYHFLLTRMGNCRCFYGASRLLLERAGYMTMMVRSTKSSAVTHYWNLVSTDGGETWYHYDPTCWGWGEDGDLCMVTDAWLADYASRHAYYPLVWDREDYPPTPEESFPWD